MQHLEIKKGGESMETKNTNVIMRNKDIVSVFVITAAILMVPLVSMQFTNDVDWDLFDFTIMGTLLVGTGLLIILASRMIKNINHRAAIIVVLLATFLLIWAELAVGIFGTPFAGS